MSRLQYAIGLLISAWYTLVYPGLVVRLVALITFAVLLVSVLLTEARHVNEQEQEKEQ